MHSAPKLISRPFFIASCKKSEPVSAASLEIDSEKSKSIFSMLTNDPQSNNKAAVASQSPNVPSPQVPFYQHPNAYGRIVVIKRSGADSAAFELTENQYIFGRGMDCDIRIQLTCVAEQHCRVFKGPDGKVHTQIDLLILSLFCALMFRLEWLI